MFCQQYFVLVCAKNMAPLGMGRCGLKVNKWFCRLCYKHFVSFCIDWFAPKVKYWVGHIWNKKLVIMSDKMWPFCAFKIWAKMINKIMHIYSTLKLNLCDSINMIDLLQNNMKHFVGIRYIYNTLKLNLRDSINMIDLLKNNMKHFLFGTSLAHHELSYKPAG